MPFDFCNRAPADWHEGANDGHLYELRFRQAPDDEQLAVIARRFERDLSQGPAQPASAPWLFSGPFARFRVGERWSCAARAAFARVADLVHAIDRVAPLAHATFLGAREGVRSPAGVTPAPALDARAVDADLPPLAARPEFEAARQRARDEIVRDRAARAAQSVDGLDLVPFEGTPADYFEPVVPDALRSGFEVPEPRTHTVPSPHSGRPTRQRVDGDHPQPDVPRGLAHVVRDGKVVGFAYLDDDGVRRDVSGLPTPLPHVHGPELHPDGARALAMVGADVYLLDFSTGRAERRFRSADGASGVAWLDELWAVKTRAALHVLDASTDPPTEVARLGHKGETLTGCLPGAVLGTSIYDKEIAFIGYCEGKLKKLAALKAKMWGPFPMDGEVVVTAGQERFAVRGLEAMYEAWAAPLREKAEKKRAKQAGGGPKKPPKKGRAKLALEPVPLEEMPAGDPLFLDHAEEEAAAFGPEPVLRRGPSGLLAALVAEGDDPRARTAVAWQGSDGEVRRVHVTDGRLSSHVFSVAPAGDLIVTMDTYTLHAVDPRDGSLGSFRPSDALGRVNKAHAVGVDDVALCLDGGVEWWQRRHGAWTLVGSAGVPKLQSIRVEPRRRLVLAQSKAKKRLVVLAQRADDLLELGKLDEPITSVRLHGERVFALAGDAGLGFELVHVAEVAEAKAARARR